MQFILLLKVSVFMYFLLWNYM